MTKDQAQMIDEIMLSLLNVAKLIDMDLSYKVIHIDCGWLAIICLNTHATVGYIDHNGKLVIPPDPDPSANWTVTQLV